ncbi:MAG: hypothetical protein A7316_03055 [Candidatus Altiarchaeales archaeon WOR_SM1_86-2]|nr:MAG: hypothetical protein A7316_03055 [Candidatus Altiarchaeales archaeon WOR_SM1_86-2]
MKKSILEFLKPTKEKILVILLIGLLVALAVSGFFCSWGLREPCHPVEDNILIKTFVAGTSYFMFVLYSPVIWAAGIVSGIGYYLMPHSYHHFDLAFMVFLFSLTAAYTHTLSCITVFLSKKILEKLKLDGSGVKNIASMAAGIFAIGMIILLYGIFSYASVSGKCCSKCMEEYEKEAGLWYDNTKEDSPNCSGYDIPGQECREFFEKYGMDTYDCSNIFTD